MKRSFKIASLLMALCLILSVSVFASGDPSAEPAATAAPGTYTTDAISLTIADDMTFVAETIGENMDGAAFSLTVGGTVTADGVFTITSLKDGDLELIELASEDQLAANYANLEAALAAGSGAGAGGGVTPGVYTTDAISLTVADDMTFIAETVGENMDGAAFSLTVGGTVTADGVFTITSLKDGDLELIELASEEQLAANYANLEAAVAPALASGEAAGAVAPGTYTDGVNTLTIADDLTFSMVKAGENMDGAAFALTVSGTVTADGVFTITSLKDGDIELIEMATEDQLAADLASVQAAFAG